MNGAGMDGCADHNHGRTFSELRYLRHGESTYKYQVSKSFRQNLLVIPSAESSCILVQADTILMLRSSTTYNKKCSAQNCGSGSALI